jgi:hypothetical protein
MGDPIGGATVIACWRPRNTHSRARTDDPAVAFENVSLPFECNVVLREIPFVVHAGADEETQGSREGHGGAGDTPVARPVLRQPTK